MNSITPAVKNLLIVNILMFIIYKVCFMSSIVDLNYELGLFHFLHENFRPYQLFTHFFMHGNEMHLAFNMISLYSVGSLLERFWGSKRMLNFYLLCGIGAGIFHLLIQTGFIWHELGHFTPNSFAETEQISSIINLEVVGASGAIFGIFTAIALLFPNTEFFIFFIPFPIKAKYLLIAASVISLFLGLVNLRGDNVAHFGHLGGIVSGYILVKYFNRDRRKFY